MSKINQPCSIKINIVLLHGIHECVMAMSNHVEAKLTELNKNPRNMIV